MKKPRVFSVAETTFVAELFPNATASGFVQGRALRHLSPGGDWTLEAFCGVSLYPPSESEAFYPEIPYRVCGRCAELGEAKKENKP